MKVDQVRIGNNHLFKVPIAPITFLPEETKSGGGVGRLSKGPTCALGVLFCTGSGGENRYNNW